MKTKDNRKIRIDVKISSVLNVETNLFVEEKDIFVLVDGVVNNYVTIVDNNKEYFKITSDISSLTVRIICNNTAFEKTIILPKPLNAEIIPSQKSFVLVDEDIAFDFNKNVITNTVTDENVTLYYNQTPVVVPFDAPVPFIFVYGSKELRFKLEDDGLYITRFGAFTEEISIILSEGIEKTILMGENVNKIKVCSLNVLEQLADNYVSGIYADATDYEQDYFEITRSE